MPLPPCNAKCAIHCATAAGSIKVNRFFDFLSVEPFGSTFFMSSWSPVRAIGSTRIFNNN